MRQTLDVLDLAHRLIEEAARGETGGPAIVSATVEDLDRHALLFEQAIRHAEGAFVEAAASADGVPEGLRLDDLERVVGGAFTHPGKVTMTRSGGRVIASMDGASTSGASAAVRESLGLATALFDAQLQGHALVAITYRETNLDPFAADEAWSFFARQLRGIPLGTIKSIVVLVNTPKARYRRFCTPDRSLRFRLEGGRLTERKPWSVDAAHIRDLRGHAFADGLVLFLGAGFSHSSQMPFGNELRDEAIRSLVNSRETRSEELAGLLLDRLHSEGRLKVEERALSRSAFAEALTLERVLDEELARLSATASPTLRYVAERDAAATAHPAQGPASFHELVKAGAKVLVLTVNFDHLAEAGLENVRVFADDDEFAEAAAHIRKYLDGSDPRVPILKLHGTIDRPETIVATDNLIFGGIATNKRAALIDLATLRLPWAYVGYSFRDPDIRTVLASNEFQGLSEWWVAPFPVVGTEQFIRDSRPNHDHSKGTYITQGSDAFFAQLLLA